MATLLRAHADTTGQSAAVAAVQPSQDGTASGATWQQEMTILGIPANADPAATSSDDSIALIGPMVSAELAGEYAGLTAQGIFSTSTAQAAADQIAPNIRAVITYKTFAASDISVDSNTTYQRMLTYRADLRDSLAPLLKNTDAEFAIYGSYVETGDPSYLAQLSAAAQNYRTAADLTAKVVVPRDAVSYHVAILNAMEEFAAVLDAMTTHSADPVASAALLRSYDQAEQDMFDSFNALTTYYSSKTP